MLPTKKLIHVSLEIEFPQKNPQTANIDLPGYNIEQTPTASSPGDV